MRTSRRVMVPLLVIGVCAVVMLPVATADHPDPFGFWPMNESSGQWIYDYSGTGNDGTRGTTDSSDAYDPEWVAETNCYKDTCLRFQDDALVRIQDNPGLDTDVVTMAAWVYPTTYDGDTGHRAIIAREQAYKMAIIQDGWQDHAGKFAISTYNDGWRGNDKGGWAMSDFIVPKYEWTHLAGSWNGTHYAFYVNGSLYDVQQHESSYTPVEDGDWDLAIGGRQPEDNIKYLFQGKIDEAMLYNQVLDHNEVSDMPGDSTPPDTDDDYTDDGWKDGSQDVTITCTDDDSGCQQIDWRIIRGGSIERSDTHFGDSVTVNVGSQYEGDLTLEYRGIDQEDNIESWNQQRVRVDTAAPSTQITAPGESGWITGDFQVSVSDGSGAPSSPVIDTFEDGDLSEYEELDDSSSTFFITDTPTVPDSDYALRYDGTTSEWMFSYPGEGLDHYPEPGDKWSYWIRPSDPDDGYYQHYFGSQDKDTEFNHNQYELETVPGSDRMTLQYDIGGSDTNLDSATVDYEERWYRVTVEWEMNGDITATLRDDDGNQIATVSANDQTYTEQGGLGFYGGGPEAYWDGFNALSTCEYRIDDGDNGVWDGPYWRPCDGNFTVSVGESGECSSQGNDACTVEVQAEDSAGNTATDSRTYNVDYDGPDTTDDYTDDGWKDSAQDITLTCNAGGTNCDRIEWYIMSDNTTVDPAGGGYNTAPGDETTVTVGDNHDGMLLLYYRSVADSGVAEDWNVQLVRIDKQSPITDITDPDTDDWYRDDFTAAIVDREPGDIDIPVFGDLVGDWQLNNDGADDEIIDASGHDNHGYFGVDPGTTDENPAWADFCPDRQCLELNKPSTTTVEDDSGGVLTPETVALSGWVRLNEKDVSAETILYKNDSYRLMLEQGSLELVGQIVSDGCSGYCGDEDVELGWTSDGGYFTSGYEVPLEQWTHVAMTWNGTHYAFYVNGKEVKQAAAPSTNTYAPVRESDTDITMGASYRPSGSYLHTTGYLDNIRIYDLQEEDAYTPDTCEYRIQDGDTWTTWQERGCPNGSVSVTVDNTSADCTTSGEDNCTVQSMAVDRADNTGMDTAGFNIDLEPPEITCDGCAVPNPVTLDSAVMLAPAVDDPHSGVDTVEICRDASCSDPYCSYDAGTANHCEHTADYPYDFREFCIRAEDRAGNAQTRCAPDYNFEVLAGAGDPCQADDECIFKNCVDNTCEPIDLAAPQIILR